MEMLIIYSSFFLTEPKYTSLERMCNNNNNNRHTVYSGRRGWMIKVSQ